MTERLDAFVLYVSGRHGASGKIEETVRRVVDGAGGYPLEVIDVSVSPERARQDGVSAVPALSPPPSLRGRRIVGDLSEEERIRAFLSHLRGESGL